MDRKALLPPLNSFTAFFWVAKMHMKLLISELFREYEGV